MPIRKYKHGKFFGPSLSYSGLVFIATGVFVSFLHLSALLLIIPGFFLAFTSNGTLIDLSGKRVLSYTLLFGFIRTGHWVDTSQFIRFSIVKVKSRYTSYSRANVRFDMNVTDVRLLLVNHNKTKKVIINKYRTFEEAQKEMNELNTYLFPIEQAELC
jgi:hypothetical protein